MREGFPPDGHDTGHRSGPDSHDTGRAGTSPHIGRGGSAGQRAGASSGGSVVQAGRDAVVTVEHHLHRAALPTWAAAPAIVLTAALSVAVVIGVIRSGVLTRAVPAWTIPLTALVVAVPLLLRRVRRKGRAGQVFLVTSAFEQKYWVAGFVQRMHGVLDRNGLDLVLKVPERDYDASAQAYHLRRILAAKEDYVGGFLVATEVRRLRADVVEFCAELARPVVFTDVEPFEDESQYPDNASFVGYLSADLGALAGHWLVAHLRQQGEGRPHVLIVASLEHQDRQRHCADVLRAWSEDVSITVDDRCAFQRSRADDAVRAHVRLLDRRQVRLDAVFCTNDEMALGAVDALRAVPSPGTTGTVVIGVDGIVEARVLIDGGTSPLRATVVQDSHRLAESAVHVLERMRGGRGTAKRTILQPELHQAE